MGKILHAVAATGMTLASVGTWTELTTTLLQPQPAKPSQPNPQPKPQNPQPQPQNPQPGTQNPTPSPRTPISNPNDKPPLKRERRERPFAFQAPQMEGKFNQSAQRLAAMEQRMQRSHEDVLRKLGEARQLTGERQN